MPTDSKADLAAYLAANKTPDPAVVAAWEKAIALEAAAANPPAAIVPPAIDSRPERSTAQFLADAHADEWARRGQLDAEAILAKPAWDREANDAERAKAIRSLQLGGEGQTYISGMRP
jgi:hypothetical protein